MWQIKEFELKPATLDFSSSEQGKVQVTQLFSEGIQLINAIELVEWDTDSQFLICEECGFTNCKPQDWVSVRRAGSLVLFLPASIYVWTVNRMDKTEYSPPAYLKQKGIPYLSFSTYEALKSRHASFPATDEIPPLQLKEATLLFHWTAPDNVLGELPEIDVRRDLIIGASEGNQAEHLTVLQALMEKQYKIDSPAQLRSVATNEQVISLYLDDGREWQAMVFDGSEYRLLVESKYVVDHG